MLKIEKSHLYFVSLKKRNDSGLLCDILLLLGPGHFCAVELWQVLRMKAGAGGWDTRDGKEQLLLASLTLRKVPAPLLDNCV